jgi:hypothetical protein
MGSIEYSVNIRPASSSLIYSLTKMANCDALNYTRSFLGAFAKLRRATISTDMSVRPSVRMEQLGSQSNDFHENSYLSIFRKSVEKIQLLLKSDKNNGHFT